MRFTRAPIAAVILASFLCVACAPGSDAAPAGSAGKASARQGPFTQGETSSWEGADDVSPPIGDQSTDTRFDGAGANSLCHSNEQVLFACAFANGKRVSMCVDTGAGDQAGITRYAYGTRSQPELVVTNSPKPAASFKRTHLMFAGDTGGYAYSFQNGDAHYVLYSISGADGLGRQGVVALTASGEALELQCEPGSVVDSEDQALLGLTTQWPSDEALVDRALEELSP